jgi:hypothetical protein
LAGLRGQLLRLPLLITAQLPELSHNQLYGIRTRVECALDDFLEELNETIGKAADPQAIAKLEEAELDADAARAREEAAARKRDSDNAKRREKRKAKQHG